MKSWIRPLRLQPKLVASYVVLGACISLLSLIGGRMAQEHAFREDIRRDDLVLAAEQIATLANAASEEGFSFIVSGDPGEKVQCFHRLDDATRKAQTLADLAATTAVEKARLAGILDGEERVRTAAIAMFEDYEQAHHVSRGTYDAYEAAIDNVSDRVAEFTSSAGAETLRELAIARRNADLLTLLVGLAATLVAAGLGVSFGHRITRPLLALRKVVLAFGSGNLEARATTKDDDEIGELAAAFEKMAADTRRHMEQRFEDIFASISDYLVVCRADGTVAAANAACCDASGYTEQQILGEPVLRLFPDGTRATESADQETMLNTASGKQVPVRLSASRLRGRNTGEVVLVARDLSERNRLEAELRQAQKMEAMGRLAGGVAHDFNNMLNVILGYTTMILEGMPPGDPLYLPISEVRQAGERSADLTQQLLAFSRQQSVERKTVNLNDGVESTLRMVRRVMGEDVAVTTVLSSEPCCIEIAPGQVEQMLMNLVVNARDAMPRGGQLTIETRMVNLSPDEAARHGVRAGRCATLVVKDDGSGMDAETLARVFDPFFTTKEQGKGTGLGLSTLFGIMRQNDGFVTVDSTVGEGSIFRLFFPEGGNAPLAIISAPPPSRQVRMDSTVLLVEDEELVRNLMDQILRRKGYQVLVARHPEEALRVCADHAGPIDLLVTDVIMPQMNGRELADRLLAARPAMKVLYMSGYTADVVLDSGVGNVSFLQKPISPDLLGRTVHGLLAAPPVAS